MSTLLVVAAGEADRADRYLRRRFPDAPRRELAKLFEKSAVRRGPKRLAKGDRVCVGDEIEIDWIPASRADTRPQPENGPLEILYQDSLLVAINKPPGMATHPLEAGELGTAANLVAHAFPDCANASDDPREGGAVHRLDHGTSGVLLFARTPGAYALLRNAFRDGRVDKRYLVVTNQLPTCNPIDERLQQRGARAVPSPDGAACTTRWRELAAAEGSYLLECQTDTGRMHQIRAHLAHAHAAIIGDSLYGGRAAPAELVEFFLHARELSLSVDAGDVAVQAPLPADRIAVLARLGLSLR